MTQRYHTLLQKCKSIAVVTCLTMGLMLQASTAMAQQNPFGSGNSNNSGGVKVAGPNLEAVEAKVQGGKITIGSTAYVVALFRSTGSSPVQIGAVNLYPSSNVSSTVSLNQCARAPLTPGAECAITLAVAALQPGAWSVKMLIEHNGVTRLTTASIDGDNERTSEQDVVIPTDVEPFPANLDFGSVTENIPMIRAFLLRNKTSEDIAIEQIELAAPEASGLSYSDNCGILAPGQGCVVSVTWTPSVKGMISAGLFIKHTGVTDSLQLEIKGDFQPSTSETASQFPDAMPNTGVLISDMTEIDFGDDIEGVSAITAMLVNDGDRSLQIKNIRLSGSDNGLSIARAGCNAGTVLEASSACPLTINWVPSREGNVVDDLQITHDGARGILVMPIRGDATRTVSRETMAVNKNLKEDVDIAPVLDGYIVTSHSEKRAIIAGPVGSILVKDGEEVVMAGVQWNVRIIKTGVELYNDRDEILLVFDRSLTPNRFDNTSSSSDDDDDDDSSSSSSSDDDE